MKFRLVEDFDDLLLEAKPAIEPGSDLEKNLIYDIENTDIPFNQLAKKYGLASSSIRYIAKRLNLHPIPRPKSPATVIKPGSELEKAIINDIKHTDKSYSKIAKDYGLSGGAVYDLATRKNLTDIRMLKPEKKFRLYFTTLDANIHRVDQAGITGKMQFLPSIYLGEYSVSVMQGMYEYIRNKYLKGNLTNAGILEFYLKLASKEISLNDLITEIKEQSSSPKSHYPATFNYRFIVSSTEELSTVDFNSVNYSQLAKDILTFFSRKGFTSNDFDTRYKDLKDAAAKVDSETSDHINQISTYISNNLEKIVHNIYSKNGDIVDPTNYIDGIPYETSFDVSSSKDIAKCMKPYKNYLLYGFMNKTGDIVYIGISLNGASRSAFYENEDRPLILQAFEDDIIKKLIIFKSNLPIQSKSINTHLMYALEVHFAEVLFKTYPANYPKALNQVKPGQNSSPFIAAQKRMDLDKYINEQDKLLSAEEYSSVVKDLTDTQGTHYPYYEYVKKYIAEHNTHLSFEDKKILYMGLRGENKELLWDYCSSENEYRSLIPKSTRGEKRQERVNDWKNYRIKNNLPITEDLDDDIDMEYYI